MPLYFSVEYFKSRMFYDQTGQSGVVKFRLIYE